MSRADATCNIHFFPGHTAEQTPAGRLQGFIPGQPGNIRHSAVQIHCPYRMSFSFILFPDRLVSLMVGIQFLRLFKAQRRMPFLLKIMGSLPALVNKIPAELQIFLLSRIFIQPDQRHFRDLMPGISAFLSFLPADPLADISGKPLRYLQQHVETEIAEGVIRGTIVDGQSLTVDSDGEKLIYRSEEGSAE